MIWLWRSGCMRSGVYLLGRIRPLQPTQRGLLLVNGAGQTPRLGAVVTKKARRRQIARASAKRRNERHQRHDSRSRLLRVTGAALIVVLAVAALVGWIVLHDSESGASSTARVGYDAASVDRNQSLNPEVTR